MFPSRKSFIYKCCINIEKEELTVYYHKEPVFLRRNRPRFHMAHGAFGKNRSHTLC
jgi:hypothetical protein